MEIFKLFGSILVSNDGANQAIDETDAKASKTSKTFGDMIATGAKIGAGILAGAAVAGGAMLALATKAGNVADGLLDLSSITGMSTDEIQKWQRVTTVAGVNIDTMTNASQKLTKSLNAMDSESNKSREAIEGLGLSFKDVTNMNADQRMDAIVDALMAVKDPTERARLGTDLLGASWKEIAPVLDIGADRLKDVKDNANIISNDDLNRANEFRIKIDQMKERLGFLSLELGVKFIPILDKFFGWISGNMPVIESVFDAVFDAIATAVTAAVNLFDEYLLPIINEVFDFIQANFPAMQANVETVFYAITDIASTMWQFFKDNILPIFTEMYAYVMAHMPEIQSTMQTVFDAIIRVVGQVWAFFKDNLLPILASFYGAIGDNMPQIQDIISRVFGVIKDVVGVVWNIFENMLLPILGKLWDFISPKFPLIGSIIKGAFDIVIGVVEGVVTVFEKVTGAIKTAYGWFTKWKDTKASKDTNYMADPPVGNNAKGTDFWRGGPTWVGEEGPEIVNLSRGARVTPHNESIALARGGGEGTIIAGNNFYIREEADIEKISQRLFDLQQSAQRSSGRR